MMSLREKGDGLTTLPPCKRSIHASSAHASDTGGSKPGGMVPDGK